MTRWSTTIACALFAFATGARADDTKTHGKAGAVVISAKDLKWSAAPPDLPKGGEMAVVHGDPTKAGEFTLRFKMPDGYKIPPHWHSHDEQVTVLSGSLVLHMGDTMTSDAHELEVGAYHFLPGKAHHGAEAKGETIVQISGPGPFDIHYVNRADNPNPKTARK